MASRKTKFPVEKPYLKVDRSVKSWKSSSSRQADLSYSYSCVKAFEKNQYIIAELAFNNNKGKYKGWSHEPALFSLSGDREKPVCDPFYYSTHSEHNISEQQTTQQCSANSIQEEIHSQYEPDLLKEPYKVNQSCAGDFVQDFHSEGEPESPDLQVLVQWLKYHFKHINYLWPFSKTNYNCITNLCKRNKKMKMEMLLNNLEDGTKSKLKKYLAQMKLNMEERFSLCNESIIEVDISPIAENPERLQEFLIFLRSLELGNSAEKDNVESALHSTKVTGKQEMKNGITPKQLIEHSSLFENTKLTEDMFYNDVHIASNNKQPKKSNQVATERNKEKPIEKCNKVLKNRMSTSAAQRNHTEKDKSHNNIHIENDENGIGNCILDSEGRANQNINKNAHSKFIINKSRLQCDRTIQMENPEKKTRINLTYSEKPLKVQNKTNAMNPSRIINNTNNQNVFYVQREITDNIDNNQILLAESQLSCKCLLHQSREDYIRYKNQCLFGKGDENSNRFLKYVISNNERGEGKCIANEKSPLQMKSQTFYVESVDDDPPSVTKLVNNDKVKTEPGREKNKPRIIKDKYRKNKDNENTNSKSNMQERENYNNLQNKPNTCSDHNFFHDDYIHNGRNISLESKNNVVQFCKIGVDDVEKLVCAVNLSNHTISNDCFTIPEENSNDNLNVRDNYYKQDALNACFESLDYSINSFSTNNEENAHFKQSALCSNSQKPMNKPSNCTQDNSISISTENSNQNKTVNNTFKLNRFSVSENQSFDSEEGHSNYSYESYPSKCYEERSINSTRTQPNRESYSFSSNKSNSTKMSPNQLHCLVKNTTEAEKDMLHLNHHLSQHDIRKKTMDCRKQQIYTLNESHKQNKTNLLIRINSGGKRQISEATQTIANKKHLNLNSLKPRNIYRSISSIFKGNRAKYKEGSRNLSHKTSSLECYKPLSRNDIGDGEGQVDCGPNDTKKCITPQSRTPSQNDDQLLLTCLEKLYDQLARQQNEIKNIKKVLGKHVK